MVYKIKLLFIFGFILYFILVIKYVEMVSEY